MAQDGVQNLVAVGEDVSRDFDALANGALDGETAAIDFGPNIFNDHSLGRRRLDELVFTARHLSAIHRQYRPPRVQCSSHFTIDRFRPETRSGARRR